MWQFVCANVGLCVFGCLWACVRLIDPGLMECHIIVCFQTVFSFGNCKHVDENT